jgi:hypothetical protein
LTANENAIPFYEKLGMKKADDVMQYNHMEWTEFTNRKIQLPILPELKIEIYCLYNGVKTLALRRNL